MTPPRERVYCSGPLFCPEELAGMTRLADVLEAAGYDTFLPHRDGLEALLMPLVNDPRANLRGLRRLTALVHRSVFALDVFQLVECCDALVFNMNGRVPDEGGTVEAALAFATGTPLVLYKDDRRSKLNGHDNSMITGLSWSAPPVDDVTAIPAAVRAALADSPGPPADLAPHLRDAVVFGRRVWALLERLPPSLRTDGAAPGLLKALKELAG